MFSHFLRRTVGFLGSAAETHDITRERRAPRVWRQQLHALIEAASASPDSDFDWQVYLLQWTTLRGQPGATRRKIDTERITEWLQDPDPFCDRLST